MDKKDALEPILRQYANEPLGPKDLSNLEMGYIYEELLRKFSEQSGEEAVKHFTPSRSDSLNGGELLNIQLSSKETRTKLLAYMTLLAVQVECCQSLKNTSLIKQLPIKNEALFKP